MKALKIAGFLFVISYQSHAQIVPTESNLRSAIAAGGTITFSGSGVITLNAPLTNLVDTVIDAGTNIITIDGQNSQVLFKVVTPGVHLTLKNVILANGFARGVDYNVNAQADHNGYGGALQNHGGVVLIQNSTFTNNVALGGTGPYNPLSPFRYLGPGGQAMGGAIWQNGGSIVIEGGFFLNNKATGGNGALDQPARGGAIFALDGELILKGVAFVANSNLGGPKRDSLPGGDGRGGAVYSSNQTFRVEMCRFTNNTAQALADSVGLGGAIAIEASAGTITNSYFESNLAQGGSHSSISFGGSGLPGQGGGIYLSAGSSVTIDSSTFQLNVSKGGQTMNGPFNPIYPHGSGYGGAIYNAGSLNLINTTIFGNAAVDFAGDGAGYGGAVFNSGTLAATNVTISGNTSSMPVLFGESGLFTFKNSIIGKNSYVSSTAGITDAGYNITATATPAFTQPSSQTNVDPRLGPIGNYGGFTPTIPILAGSPAINAADDAAAPAFDQRGRARPFGSHSDIGAFESSPPYQMFGMFQGYRNATTAATHGQTTLMPDTSGRFHFEVLSGQNTFTFTATNTVFRTNPISFDVTADDVITPTGFAFNSLAPDLGIPIPNFTLAGRAGETWELHASSDLVTWTPVATNTFASDGLMSVPISNAPLYVKGVRKN